MTVHRNILHTEQVEAWEMKNAQSVSSKELPQLYAKAIQAIEQRSLATLSRVTVSIVIDRALHEIKEKFPTLDQVKATPEGIDFSVLLGTPDLNSNELKNAFREVLIELLNVFGNITGNILTGPLHKELMAVTHERPLYSSVPQTLRSMNPAKNNRDQK